MFRRLSVLLPGLVCVAGCDVLSLIPELVGNDVTPETGVAKLIPFDSEEALLDYWRSEIAARDARSEREFFLEDVAVSFDAVGPLQTGAPVPGTDGPAAATESGFSQTTTQEVGVDEADVVKTDGTFLYMVRGGEMLIVRIGPPTEMASIAAVAIDGFARELYLDGDRVVVLSDIFGAFVDEDVLVERDVPAMDTSIGVVGDDGVMHDRGSFAPFSRPQTVVTIVDVADVEHPMVKTRTRFDGSMASSRMVDGALYLVIANYQQSYQSVLPRLASDELDLEAVDLEMLLPQFERTDADGVQTFGNILTYEDLYRPTDADGFGVVSVVSMNARRDGLFEAVGVIAEPGLIYSSQDALYLTDSNFDLFANSRNNTDIYQFAYENGRALPVASGVVPGRILNQYSMGEHDGYLRVATTVRPNGLSDVLFSAPETQVHVLEQTGDALNTVGSLVGVAPGETVQAARFIGDRGYLVTFEQVDPLFTLDLSDPADPRVVGELKVPGFSTFIVPMDENHLLTVGQYIPEDVGLFRPWGVQLSVFDVTDFSAPVLAHSAVIGGDVGAYSEALRNPKAFTYFAESGRVALPVSIFAHGPIFIEEPVFEFDESDASGGDVGMTDEPIEIADPPIVITDPPPGGDLVDIAPTDLGGFDGLMVYEVSADDGFSELHRISTRFAQGGFFGAAYTRGIFADGFVYAVTDHGVRARSLDEDDDVEYELFLGPRFNEFDNPPPMLGGGN